MVHKLLVVGGNGFVGSAVCKAALARGWDVSSISSSGRLFRTPKGHAPAWTSKVNWHAASALSPETYAPLLRDRTAVVHTVGTLLETAQYKDAVRSGDVGGLAKTLFGSLAGGDGGNPLKRGAAHPGSYETLNRDTADLVALRVCEAFVSTVAGAPAELPLADSKLYSFIYLSAEDMGRPVIPRRYIETKRQAEHGIQQLCKNTPIKTVFMRPSFIYHPHLRPITSPIAALASLSATLHENAPTFVPTPSSILRMLAPAPVSPTELPSALNAMASTLELAPIHLDHVGEAVCVSIERQDVEGPVGVKKMRQLIGWEEPADKSMGKEHS